jgi:hypothetical protein
MKKSLSRAVVVAGFAVAVVPMLSFAAYLQAGSNVFVTPTDAPTGNAYVAGGNVEVMNPVGGDLLAAGGTVSVSGKVGQDIMVAGGTVNIVSASAQDVRVVGGNITIGGKFTGELAVAGGQITVLPETTIANDSYVGGGTVNFGGNEAGNLTIAGGAVRIDGVVAGNLTITKAKQVTIGSHAVIKKNFEYTAATQAVMEQGAQVTGQTVFHQAAPPAPRNGALWAFAGIVTAWFFIKFIVALTAAYLLWYLRKKDMQSILEAVQTSFWRELLRGFSFMVLIPIAVIIAFVTIIGAIPALVALLVYIAVLVLASPIAFIFTASLFKKNSMEIAWYHILLGALVFCIVGIIPFVGWIACFVVYLVSLGGLVNVFKLKFRRSE